MSGHSKWSQIKHKKALTDAKKAKVFSKLTRQITVAARAKGGDAETNPNLRMFVEKAHFFNMPQENIERAIKKGTGELEGVKFEEFILEAFGPDGTALIIEGTTDNKNRTVSEIKFLLSESGGKIATPGSVVWLFERCGALNITKGSRQKDVLELEAIEAGAQDLAWLDEENLEIYTNPGDLENARKKLERQGITINEASLDWRAKDKILLEDAKDKDHLQKLFEALDENDDINEIYSNVSSL
jgi:YebC/PmpR family DNA-binding regulatory protein